MFSKYPVCKIVTIVHSSPSPLLLDRRRRLGVRQGDAPQLATTTTTTRRRITCRRLMESFSDQRWAILHRLHVHQRSSRNLGCRCCVLPLRSASASAIRLFPPLRRPSGLCLGDHHWNYCRRGRKGRSGPRCDHLKGNVRTRMCIPICVHYNLGNNLRHPSHGGRRAANTIHRWHTANLGTLAATT